MNYANLKVIDAGPAHDLVVDGRTARRHRNKAAVLDAMIALTRELNEEPAVELIAERAGVSYRSIYRYFDDRTDLMLSAIRQVIGDMSPLIQTEFLGEGEFEDRLRRYVELRLSVYRQLAPLTRLAVRRSADQPLVRAELAKVRQFQQAQFERQFAAELADIDDSDVVMPAINALFLFEPLEYLAEDVGLDDAAMIEVLARHITAHLAAAHHTI